MKGKQRHETATEKKVARQRTVTWAYRESVEVADAGSMAALAAKARAEQRASETAGIPHAFHGNRADRPTPGVRNGAASLFSGYAVWTLFRPSGLGRRTAKPKNKREPLFKSILPSGQTHERGVIDQPRFAWLPVAGGARHRMTGSLGT